MRPIERLPRQTGYNLVVNIMTRDIESLVCFFSIETASGPQRLHRRLRETFDGSAAVASTSLSKASGRVDAGGRRDGEGGNDAQTRRPEGPRSADGTL